MKKIININLSGRVIPIEDAAYETLQRYIESLRRYFASEEGRDEIINDIESRIAELMNDKVKKGIDAITDADVEDIVNAMGRVEDFEAADKEASFEKTAEPEEEAPRESFTERKPRGRLYRDTNDKFLGGVCSGISNYTNVDPTVVRLLFAVLGLATGLGILIYIVLWIVLPSKELEGYTGKKMYRNPDDRMLGGVAGGLAAYLNVKANTLRLIFVAPLLLNLLIRLLSGGDYGPGFFLNLGIGSLTGTFILVYIILWIVLPEALTDYQKMEMRGETVDINRIRENVKAGMQNMKGRVQEWGTEVKNTAQQFSAKTREYTQSRGQEFSASVGETARRSASGIGHAIGVLFRVFFIFIASIFAFSLFVALIALLFSGVAWSPLNNFLWTSSSQQFLAWGTLLLFITVPLVGMIVWIVRRIIRVRTKSPYLGWVFGGLWTIGWVFMVLFVSGLFREFRHNLSEDTAVNLVQPSKGKMLVTVSQPILEYNGDFAWMQNGNSGWDLSPDTIRIAAIHLHVVASPDDQYRVITKKYSFGKTRTEALRRAGHIQYAVVSRDSILDLGNHYAIGREDKFRGQHVDVEIQVPVGKKIRFDPSVTEKLNLIHVKVIRSRRQNRTIDIDIDDEAFRFSTGVDYVMDPGGQLLDPDGKPPREQTNEYRYPGTDRKADSVSLREEAIKKQIEEEKKQLEEQEKRMREEKEKRIRELEQQLNRSTRLRSREMPDARKQVTASVTSPVSTLVQWF